MSWPFTSSSWNGCWLILSAISFGFVDSDAGFAQDLSDEATPAKQAKSLSDAELKFFESKVRPILVEHCYACHSQESGVEEGNLRLDSRESMRRGGNNGPTMMLGDPESSPLIRAVSHASKEIAMPPPDAGRKLSDEEIGVLKEWIRMGAPDPREESEGGNDRNVHDAAKEWWAFQPVNQAPIPEEDNPWCYNDIDRFVWTTYRSREIQPVADAEPRTLLRRVYFDLIGLPPTVDEIATFDRLLESGKSLPKALEVVVDSLLQSNQYGMHWGRHWLDVARYAESSGRDVNVAYPHAWRYRDYVISAFNDNMPYDQFLREQIAGDLLEAKTEKDRTRQTIATGFLAIGSKSLNERNPKQFAVDTADEQIDAAFQASMALTVACARCHDHKFDPISQKEYTAVAGIFLSTLTKFGTNGGPQVRNSSPLAELSSAAGTSSMALSPDEIAKMKKQLEELRSQQADLVAERRKEMRAGNAPAANPRLLRIAAQIADLEGELSSHRSDGTAKPLAMAVSDKSTSTPRYTSRPRQNRMNPFDSIDDSPLFVRGDITKAGSKVPRGLPALFESMEPVRIADHTSGRKELANWITSRNNPMTARVAVNRIWYWLFGQGLVTSLDNFGTTGSLPSHPELLDFLATKYMASGWDTKALIREILRSHTYQLSTSFDEANSIKDADNVYLWRANRRRLPAESIRDAMLSAAGTLDGKPQSGSLIALAGDGQIGGPRDRGIAEARITEFQSNARSVYLPVPRSIVPEALEVFDLPDASAVQTLRESTNVPSQSLFLLNNRFCSMQAKELAERILETYPGKATTDDFAKRLTLAFQLTFARDPSAEETLAARKLVSKLPNNPKAAWVSIARSLFATAEFRYLD